MTVRRLQRSIRKTWRRFFRPNLVPIHADGRFHGRRPSGAPRPTLYVLPRAICGFSRVQLAGKTANARAATKLNAAYRQGFTDGRTRLECDKNDPLKAGVWCWEGEFRFENGVLASSAPAIPETVAREKLQNGARLVRCIDGFEGQVWRDKTLIASRWWSEPPSDREWIHFLRAARQPIEGDVSGAPAPCEAPFRTDLPIIDPDPANLQLTFAPSRVAAVVACFIAFFAAFETAQIIAHRSGVAAINARIDNAIASNEAGLEARRAALAANAQIDELSNFEDPETTLLVLLAVSQELPAEHTRIANFRVYDQQLETRVNTSEDVEINIPDLVSRLERNDALSDVFVERRNDRLIRISAAIGPVGAVLNERGQQ